MALPAITLTDPIGTVEIWDMFWEACKYVNSLPSSVLDFGSDYDFSSSSKNLNPKKLRFVAPHGGHDHAVSGRQLHFSAVQKKQLDLNGLSVLWSSYFADGAATRYVMLSGVLDGITEVGAGTQSDIQFKGKVVTTYPYTKLTDQKEQLGTGSDHWNYDTGIDVASYLDTTWAHAIGSQYKVLGVIAQQYVSEETNVNHRPYTFVQYDGTSWYVQHKHLAQSTSEGVIEVRVLVLLRIEGTIPPSAI